MRDGHAWRNWGRTQRCEPAAVETPASELEVREAIRRARAAGQTVKVVGSGHSFTDIACTDGRMLTLDALNRVVSVDEATRRVTVEAGMTIQRLNEELALRGLALPNLGDIDRQSFAGAIATATHGTGARFGGLATFVRGLQMVTADGEQLRCSADEEPEVFHVARVGLGALGVVTEVTLQCVPAFTLHHVEAPHPVDEVLADLDRYVDSNEHFEFYWLPHTDQCATIENNRTDERAEGQERVQAVASRGPVPELLLRRGRRRRAAPAEPGPAPQPGGGERRGDDRARRAQRPDPRRDAARALRGDGVLRPAGPGARRGARGA